MSVEYEAPEAARPTDVDDEVPRSERITTPCPPSQHEHTALLADLDAALAVARRLMARVRIDGGSGNDK